VCNFEQTVGCAVAIFQPSLGQEGFTANLSVDNVDVVST
jgi:hypothetical protein